MGKNIFICGLVKQFSLMEKSCFRLTPTSPELRYHPFELKFQQDQLVAFKSNRRPDKNLLKILNNVKKCTSYFFVLFLDLKGLFFLGVFSFSFCLFYFGFLYFLPRVSKLIYTHIVLAHSMMPAYPQQWIISQGKKKSSQHASAKASVPWKATWVESKFGKRIRVKSANSREEIKKCLLHGKKTKTKKQLDLFSELWPSLQLC